MAIDFNTEPYYDDFNESKRFLRILYRPGFAVQARELTQMQTILQNQISRFGDHVFKEGAMIIPGNSAIDTTIGYVKLQGASGAIQNLVGLIVQNSAGVKAQVIYYVKPNDADPAALYIRYVNSGDNTTTKTFSNADNLTNLAGTNSAGTVVAAGTYIVQAAATDATGTGSISTIQQGVYYLKGHFVLVPEQTIILDKFSNASTYSFRIGLTTTEEIITSEDDATLYDNAQNSFNYAAPGAHRYYIDAVLTKLSLESEEDTDFIELIRFDGGTIQRRKNKTEYSILEQEFAHRTYDESGNYTVKNFEIDVREYRNNNRGAWAAARYYITGDVVTNNGNTYVAKDNAQSVNNGAATPGPVHTSGVATDGSGTGVTWEWNPSPFYNRGVFTPSNADASNTNNLLNEKKLAVGLEPGKAYVQGFEIEKPSTSYVPVDKARESVQVTSQALQTTVGNYVTITNLWGAPPIGDFSSITLYDRPIVTGGTIPSGATAVGTARVRFIEWDSGSNPGSASAIYKLSLFDVKMTGTYDFNRKVKSFFFSGGSAGTSFSADINPILTITRGAGTSKTSNTYVTDGAGVFIKGSGTTFQTDFIVGDIVSFGGTKRRVVAVTAQDQMEIDSSITIVDKTADRLSTTIIEPESTSLVYQLPQFAIKSVKAADGTTISNYTVYQRFSSTYSGSALSFSVNSGSTFASTADTDNYIVVNSSTGTVIPSSASNGYAISGTGTTSISVSFTGTGVPTSSNNITLIAAVNKTAANVTRKTKTLVTSAVVTFNTQGEAQATEVLLGKADGYRLVSVKMKSGTFAAPIGGYTIDISDRYDWDNGQRLTHYDLARLVLKNSYAPPEAPIEVTFDYFTHDSGDYCTVDSYVSNQVSYTNIPSFIGISLRDCVDFRPIIADSGLTFSSTNALVPKRGIDFVTHYSYYLSRKTKIAVDFSGEFFAIDGVPSLNPGEPLDPTLGLVLYTLTLEPYTFGTNSNNVQINRIDNKRYTMRDIGKLEKRIDNLEYYTSLSLLEQQTESLNIVDSTGNTRFKNGFIVDGFVGHATGDTLSPDYVCSIDMENAELRPFYSMNNINLLEKNNIDSQRTNAGYKLYGDVITLPLNTLNPHVKIIDQPYASRLENINPFAVFTFLGDVKINPSSDDWFEIDRRPDLVIDVEGNFNTIKNLAEKTGVLGTIWNAWQTQWTGASTNSNIKYTFGWQWASGFGDVRLSQAEANAKFGGVGWGNARQITVEATATQVGQARTGVKTSLVQKIDRQIIGDRVLSTAALPYIRSRNILIQIQKLKPNTRFYPFFDGADISAYCTPASKIVYTPTGTATFFTDVNVGSDATATARRILGDSQVCLNRGDVITGATSLATAVVVGTEYDPETIPNAYALYVVNVKGTFQNNEVITGSNSLATGTFTSLTAKAQGSTLVSNFNGNIQLLFNIPNTESIRFRCGTRELKLVDVTTADGQFTSRARANYRAEGILETRETTIHSVRNAQLVEEQLSENQVIMQSSERIVADTGWWDPLAQSFLIDVKGGCFLSKVDVFFATRDLKIPVMLELREVVNGVPGKRVLPFSRVTLKPEQVDAPVAGATINAAFYNTVLLDGVTVAKWDKPTTFTFPSPVYVAENTEYCMVLASDCNSYNVWISQVGELMVGTSRTISEQPYLGSLFKSQNASTWTADQTQDIKFAIYRANFRTDIISNVEYINDAVPLQTLDYDPFETRVTPNVTNHKVRVWHTNHGMPSGSKVTISGVTVNVNGIPFGEFNVTHTISDVDLDSYVITIGASGVNAATSSGYGGGSTVKATRNIQFDAIQPSIQIQSFSETPIEFGFKATTGKAVDNSSQTAYATPETLTYESILVNETNNFFAPKMVASEINELPANSGWNSDIKSLYLNCQFSSTNSALSPILDTHRTSLITINNKINSPTSDNLNVATLDDNVLIGNYGGSFLGSSAVSFSGTQISTRHGAMFGATVGKYITVSGSSNAANNGTFLVASSSIDGGTALTGTFSSTDSTTAVTGTLFVTNGVKIGFALFQGSTFIGTVLDVNSETSITLTANAALTLAGVSGIKYYTVTTTVSRTDGLTFTTEAVGTNAIMIKQRERFVAETAPDNSSSLSKYVTKKINLANASTFLRIKFAVNLPVEAGIEVWYKTSPVGSATEWNSIPYTQMTPDAVIPYYSNSTGRFIDASFSKKDMENYDSVKVKIVMKSTNSSEVPRIKDLRIISCA
jgi:hypothetical protein